MIIGNDYARDPATGLLVHIDDAPRGILGRLVCPECAELVVANQGEKNRWHYRHSLATFCTGPSNPGTHGGGSGEWRSNAPPSNSRPTTAHPVRIRGAADVRRFANRRGSRRVPGGGDIGLFIEIMESSRADFIAQYPHPHGRENATCVPCFDAWPDKAKSHACPNKE